MAMVISSSDMLALVAELNVRRITMVLGRELRKTGGRLDLSPVTVGWLQTARRLHHRYDRGDYRHEQDEAGRLRDLCCWLIARHRAANGAGNDPGSLEWDATRLTATVPPGAGTYRGIVAAIRAGQLDG